MIDKFRVGDGERTTTSKVPPIYFSYSELGLPMSEEFFNEEIEKYNVYYATTEVTPIQFKPASFKKQATSNYYFLKADIKIPR